MSSSDRDARAMLDWSLVDFARASDVSASTFKRIEEGSAGFDKRAALAAIRGALETGGIRLLPNDGNGPGIRLWADVERR